MHRVSAPGAKLRLDKPTARRILDFIDASIANQADPRATGKALTGPTFGTYWRYRVGDNRVICDVQDSKLCMVVIQVGNRREVYRWHGSVGERQYAW